MNIQKTVLYLTFLFFFLNKTHCEWQKSTRSCIDNNCTHNSINQTYAKQHYLSLQTINRKTKILCEAGIWNLSKGGFYKPLDTASSSPMIKIVTSHIELNFQGQSIENSDNTESGWIGIEVGYSPAELIANPNLRQPKDVTINNVHLRNFDCGIIIHEGVERITIHDSVIYDSSIGAVFLGQTNNPIKQATISNSKIIGHGLNKRTALVNLKTKVETTYGYPADHFLPLRADRLNSNTLDVYTYSGISAIQTKGITLSCVTIQSTGNQDFTTEGNNTRTEGISIVLRDTDTVSMQHTKTIMSYGNVNAIGLQMERVCNVNIYNSEFSYGTSNYLATGIQSFPDFLAKSLDSLSSGFDYTLEEIDLCEVKTEFQRSDNIAVGIYLTDTRGLNGNKVSSERNIATNSAFGFVSITSSDISFTDSSFNRNIAGMISSLKNKEALRIFTTQGPKKKSLGGLSNTDGIHAVGFYSENSKNTILTNTHASSNQGDNTSRGAQFVTCFNSIIKSSTFANNIVAVGKRINEDSELRAAQDNNEISRQAPTLPAASTGGYGIIFEENCEQITITSSTVKYNEGHRSSGITCNNCTHCLIDTTTIQGQKAYGNMLSSDVQSLNENNTDFFSVHQPLFLGNACGITPSGNSFDRIRFGVILRRALRNARDIQENILSGSSITAVSQIQSLSGGDLMTAAMARFRLWGTAFGIHLHNIKNAVISNTRCVHQASEQDSAAGIIISGRSTGFEIINCNLSYNEGWTNSAQQLWTTSPDPDNPQQQYQYDLSAMKDFWYMVAGTFTNGWTHAADTATVGFYTGTGKGATDTPDVMIAQGEQPYGVGNRPDIALPNIRPSGGGNANRRRQIIPLFGPAAAGLLISDIATSGYITNCACNNNFGHAGQGSGIILQHGFNITLVDNIIFHNGTNMYGLGWGIFDYCNYSPNTYVRNFFNYNHTKNIYQMNAFIPMNNVGGNSLQLDQLTNGAYNLLERPVQNAEINIPLDANACIVESSLDGGTQSNIVATWIANSWVA